MNSQARLPIRRSVAYLVLGAMAPAATPAAPAVVVLHSFESSTGTLPYGGLTLGSDGNLYGTTNTGGAAGLGAAYKVDHLGYYSLIHSFAVADGTNPYGGLVEAGGTFYGTGYGGGAHAAGTVFAMTPAGNTTTLYDFKSTNDGQNPKTALLLASDGNLYGTTENSSVTSTFSTVFQITTGGSETVLHAFVTADGTHPQGALIEGADGMLYGTVEDAGTYAHGAAFKLSKSGGNTFADLHFFHDTDGQDPADALFQASDGNFYGTTVDGGTAVSGTVFKMDTLGNVTNLHSFSSTPDGMAPYSGLVQAADGTLYGTTTQGGQFSSGTIFTIDHLGTVTTIYSFAGSPADGSHPVRSLVIGPDGDLWGTTLYGGSTGNGTIYKVRINTIMQSGFDTPPQ